MSERVSVCEKERVNERFDVSLNEMSLEEKLNMLSRQRWTKRETDSGYGTDREREGQAAGRGQAGRDRQQVEGRQTLSHSNKCLFQECKESWHLEMMLYAIKLAICVALTHL